MMAAMATRIATALVALAVVAALGLGLRDARLEQQGTEAAQSDGVVEDPRLAREADRKLREAGLLNPGTDHDLARGGLLFRVGRREEGIRLTRDVVRREPENLPGWSVLRLMAAQTGEIELERTAGRRLRELLSPDDRG